MMLGVGIDLGGTQVKGAAFDLESGEITTQKIVPTRDGERIDGQSAFVTQVCGLVADLDGENAECVGISAPGLANRDGSCINFMPGRLDGLEGLVWSDAIGKPAFVINDAHAALLGEWWQGSAKEFSDVILLTLGTGVGGAVMCDGKLLRGHIGRAGHLGHISMNPYGPLDICNTPGSLEDFVGNHNVSERSGGKFASTRELVDALKNDDSDAEKVWDVSMRALAVGIAGLVNCFDPEAVLIGGGISAAWDDIEPRVGGYLDTFEWRPGGHRVDVRKATLGEWAGVYGAMAFAKDEKGVR